MSTGATIFIIAEITLAILLAFAYTRESKFIKFEDKLLEIFKNK
jgi:hypothetical protein